MRFAELVSFGRDAAARIEANLEPRVELGVVRLEALPNRGARRLIDLDLYEPGREEPLDHAHRLHETRTLVLVERFDQRPREIVAPTVEQLPLDAPGSPQPRDPNTSVLSTLLDDDQPLGLEHPQQPAHITRIEVEAGAQHAHVEWALADLQRTREAPRGRPRAKYSSLRTPIRCVTVRLKARTP